MDFESGFYMAEEGMAEFFSSMFSIMSANMLSFAVSILAYVLLSLGLYTIAQRREIKEPWMAWVPILRLWVLGSIADQYRYVARGENRSRRKMLIVTAALQIAAKIAMAVLLVVMVIRFAMELPHLEMLEAASGRELVEAVLKIFLPVGIGLAVLGVISIVHAVFYYIACADLFASCEPENKTVYLVLGILIGITLPVFVFVSRKKDLGMPPRRQTVPEIQ